MPTEKWLPIPGYEGRYEVSDHGNVRRMRPSKWGKARSLLKPRDSGNGYLRVTLGSKDTAYIHHLVLRVFVGPSPPGHQCNHKNGQNYDNRVENLEWVSPKQNIAHAIEHGFMGRGESHPNAKLTADDVRQIRKLYAAGHHTQASLAQRFGVTNVLISKIVRGESWSHIEGAIPDQVPDIAQEHAQTAHIRGEQSPNAKLTADDVRELRRLYLTDQWASEQLAARYSVSDVSILAALHGETWAHIDADFDRIEQLIREHKEHPDRQGERNGRARLTADDVRAIRRLYATGKHTQAQLGARFGVSSTNIGMIVNRRTWAHIQ